MKNTIKKYFPIYSDYLEKGLYFFDKGDSSIKKINNIKRVSGLLYIVIIFKNGTNQAKSIHLGSQCVVIINDNKAYKYYFTKQKYTNVKKRF